MTLDSNGQGLHFIVTEDMVYFDGGYHGCLSIPRDLFENVLDQLRDINDRHN